MTKRMGPTVIVAALPLAVLHLGSAEAFFDGFLVAFGLIVTAPLARLWRSRLSRKVSEAVLVFWVCLLTLLVWLGTSALPFWGLSFYWMVDSLRVSSFSSLFKQAAGFWALVFGLSAVRKISEASFASPFFHHPSALFLLLMLVAWGFGQVRRSVSREIRS